VTAAETAYTRIIDALRDHDVLDKGDDKARARCPAHNGTSSTSLAIGPRRDGKGVVVCCHAGCTMEDILAAIGLSKSADRRRWRTVEREDSAVVTCCAHHGRGGTIIGVRRGCPRKDLGALSL